MTTEAILHHLFERDRDHHKSSSKGRTIGIVVGIVAGVIIILALLILWAYRSRKRRFEANPPAAEVPLSTRLGSYSPAEGASTNNSMPLFNEEGIIEGKAAVVHKGQAGWSYMSYIS
jgi:hypothetical protein